MHFSDSTPQHALARYKLELATPSDLAVHAVVYVNRMPNSVRGGEETVDCLGEVQLDFGHFSETQQSGKTAVRQSFDLGGVEHGAIT